MTVCEMQSSSCKDNDCHLTNVKVQKFGLLVRDGTSDISTQTAVPQHAVVLLFEMMLDPNSNLLLAHA